MGSLRLASTSSAILALLVGGVAARGDGCAAGSASPAPDVAGSWAVTYDDALEVEIKVGGEVFKETLGAQGGEVTIEYAGAQLTFDIDCGRPEILCPSEAWPAEVEIEQREVSKEHQMVMTLPMQSCDGVLRAPEDAECGEGTANPECESVCDGELVIEEREAFGVIGETGESFRLYLGAGLATNGLNCAALAWSVADAEIVSEGEGTEEWHGHAFEDGVVTLGYAGGCLWVADEDADADVEAAVIGASITFKTGFTAERIE